MSNELLLGLAIPPGILMVCVFLFRNFSVSNQEGHELLHLRFGKLMSRFTNSGLKSAMARLIPWDQWISISRQWDQRFYRGIETNDSHGTSVQIDLRVNFRIKDGEKALFEVHDWDQALCSVTSHEAAAYLAGRDRTELLCSATELSSEITRSIREVMEQYGIEIESVRIMNVQFRSEVARQMFEAVAAKLEVAKAEFEERGRTEAALLLARTEEKVAELEARAKTESLKAVGRAYQVLRTNPDVYEAYASLYKLSLIDPERVVAFDGFKDDELSTGALVEADLEHAPYAMSGARQVRSARPAEV